MDDHKIIELETKLAFQERLLDQLNEVVTEQHARIDRLQKAIIRLEDKIADVAVAGGSARSPEDERPPHY